MAIRRYISGFIGLLFLSVAVFFIIYFFVPEVSMKFFGMAFDQEQEGNLRFAVSVSYPMSDLYIPLLITIRPDGSYVISKDLVLDNVVETLDTTDVE